MAAIRVLTCVMQSFWVVKLKQKDICEVLGVPTQLIGIEGSQTYANYEQTRAAFYEDRAIPLLNMFYLV